MDQINVLSKAYKSKVRTSTKYREFLKEKRYTLYSLDSTAICLQLKKDKIKNKITWIMLFITFLEVFLIFPLIEIYWIFFGISSNIVSGFIFVLVTLSIPFYFINKIIRLHYYKKYLNDNIRYICFTNDYRAIILKDENKSYVVEKVYHHFKDSYITNIGLSSSFKVMDENNQVHEVYEIISKRINSYILPTGIIAVYNDYDFWSKKNQLEYFKKNGSNLDYVDEEYIRDNSWSFKPTPSRFQS